MHSTLTIASALAVFAGQTLAVTHMVKTDGIAFSPSSISNVAEGDEISVTFSTQIPHNIISSTFSAPCTYNPAGGVASLTYKKGEVFTFQVKSTDPQWFYCSVGDHCNDGMVFAINPSSDETVEAAQAAAANADITTANNDEAIGGAVGGASGSSSSSGSGSSAAASGSMTMSSASMAMSSAMPSGSMTMSESMAMTSSMPMSSGGSMSMGGAAGSGGMATGGSMSSSGAPAQQTGGAAAAGGSVAMAGAFLAGVAAFAL